MPAEVGPEVLEALTAEIERRWPGAEIVGAESPPFTDDSEAFERSLGQIAESGADVICFGLGTPKQDLVAHLLAERHCAAFVSIGAACFFIAGMKKQAPTWVQDKGPEWTYRLATEPRRLWKRYLVGNTRFVVGNLRERPSKCASG